MKKSKPQGVQYAALPYRLVEGQLEVLLITSRQTRRWVIPKGWPMPGFKPHKAAEREALEEAGLLGEIEPEALGVYEYAKGQKGGDAPVKVSVFPFLVSEQLDTWLEKGQREARWTPYQVAAGLVAEPGLREIIRSFGREHSAPDPAGALSRLRARLWGRRE